jgi:uncharacterized protein YdiU (UPF0061 family)
MTGWGDCRADLRAEWLAVMRRKLALAGGPADDAALIDDLLVAMAGADWTLFFRRLAGATGARACCGRFSTISPGWPPGCRAGARVAGVGARCAAGRIPAVIPRNHQVEAALEAATAGDMAPFRGAAGRREAALCPEARGLCCPRPGFGRYVTFCGT